MDTVHHFEHSERVKEVKKLNKLTDMFKRGNGEVKVKSRFSSLKPCPELNNEQKLGYQPGLTGFVKSPAE